MQKLFLILTAIAVFGSTVFFLQNQTSQTHHIRAGIPEEVVAKYLVWKAQYGKFYASDDIETFKLNVFFQNYKFIQKHDPAATGYSVGINQFMDMTPEQFKEEMLTAKPIPQSEYMAQGVEIHDDQSTASVPSTVNWVEAGKVSPVKNQGQCGSCWAFSATGANESTDAIFGSGVGDFSEQQLIDCSGSFGNLGCNGGNYFWANKYIIKNGITTEQAYPYVGVNQKCKTQGGAWKISSQTMVTANSCNALQTAVAQQPVSVGVDAQTWQFYTGGVFKNCGTSIDHDVLVVGYTPSYWLVKNSWGTTWGMNGYIQLALGNTCAVCAQPGYPNK